ncbi:hypothetical protein O181_028517 [Austropuccinia psidii MF-1]|uniref:Integrase catalytic domain-containing protein n=1 Tax=Austropuccinia psidii MF-1 TaxID=1389203 RepID=A0A9Q3H2N6_9BASI|nr:hypothetical protein [Austropuccinia psidii MF-1]
MPCPIASQSNEWKKKWLTSRNPCFHWAPDCPTCKKGAVAWVQSLQHSTNVAAIGVIPMFENIEALLDSGATHSVLGNISLLDKVRPANMNLSVASSHQFCVEGIGELLIKTYMGILCVNNVLYCKEISGIVLSIVSFSHMPEISIKPLYSSETPPPSINYLTCPSNTSTDLFHPCSLSKSEHQPLHSPSCQMITEPGNAIVADLMDPLTPSFDLKKYILVIKDHFSQLTAVIPLRDKADVKHQSHLCMIKFMNFTGIKIKRLRTDNGS